MAKMLRSELVRKKAQEAEQEVLQRDQPMYTARAENLNAEICYRFKSLSKRYISDFENLSDHQILEINQDKTLNIEFNEVLEKVTELASIVSLGGQPVEALLKKVAKLVIESRPKRTSFMITSKGLLLRETSRRKRSKMLLD